MFAIRSDERRAAPEQRAAAGLPSDHAGQDTQDDGGEPDWDRRVNLAFYPPDARIPSARRKEKFAAQSDSRSVRIRARRDELLGLVHP
jgi:hypothetical protein